MLTMTDLRKPRQSWTRRFRALWVAKADRTENPRVGGSTPSQATSLQRLAGILLAALVLHLQLAAGAGAQESGRLRAASIDAAWIGGAAVADLWTTDYTLRRYPSCYEGHPFMRGPLLARAGVKLAMTGVGVAWADHLRRKGDRRGARLVRWGLVGLQLGLAGWNLHQARQRTSP